MEISPDAADYLATCHSERRVRERVHAHFARVIALLERHGTYIGFPYVRHLRGEMWEIRVDDPTGAYRLFFGIAPDRILAVACGRTKKADKFSPAAYDWAERMVLAYRETFQRPRDRSEHDDR